MSESVTVLSDAERLLKKCVSIFQRRRNHRFIYRFLERVLPGTDQQHNFFDEHVQPAIRNEFFPDLTVDAFLVEAIQAYRSGLHKRTALLAIWEKIDYVLPFSGDEHYELVERLEEALKRESNPPTQADWEYLDEWIMK